MLLYTNNDSQLDENQDDYDLEHLIFIDIILSPDHEQQMFFGLLHVHLAQNADIVL